MNYKQLEYFISKKIEHSSVMVIGKSVLGRDIYALKFDFGSQYNVIIQGAIHAREHITADLVCLLVKDVSLNYAKYKAIDTPNIIFVPMVNPDGVELCNCGLKSVPDKKIRLKLLKINKSKDFSLYKANVNGVDLNTNFNAKWGSGKQNKFKPSFSDYVGSSPMSEPEVQALAKLTLDLKPCFTISYHAKGQEIYYRFFNKPENIKRDGKIAKMFAKTLHYKIINVEKDSCGGYKDWCIQRFYIPALTIEVGSDKLVHPIDNKHLNSIYKRNRNIVKLLNKVTKEIKKNERIFHGTCDKTSEEGTKKR